VWRKGVRVVILISDMSSKNHEPLVAIGIPTYNRAPSLERAIESVLAQDYSNLELVISDDASEDATTTLCEEFRKRDSRVRYIRQQTNLGVSTNFVEVFKRSRGDFFMWLGSDDWLDSSYVSQCLQVLLEQPDHALVCGKAKYFEGEKFLFEEDAINLPQDSGRHRVLAYYRQVSVNGILYGVIRREHLEKVPPMQNILGDDWLLIASIVFAGKARTLESVSINRSFEGGSKDMEALALSYGLSRFLSKIPHLSIAIAAFKDIAWASPAYGSMGKLARLSLGGKAFAIVSWRFCVRAQIRLRTRLRKWLRPIS
jgi:glycosyltransferase involved in cell wall biosynthesis